LLVAVFVLIWPIHELLHVLAFPDFGFSSKTVVGFLPTKVLFFALFEGEVSRNRFLVAGAAPVIVLTVVPLLAAAVFRLDHPLLAFVSVANALVSAIDLVAIGILLVRVPSRAVLRAKGWKTYWRPRGAA
jgi:hypothetical protein